MHLDHQCAPFTVHGGANTECDDTVAHTTSSSPPRYRAPRFGAGTAAGCHKDHEMTLNKSRHVDDIDEICHNANAMIG